MKFLADSMLGKLAKALRILGFDTEYVRTEEPLEILARARNESRVLLTRNRMLKDRPGVFFVKSEKIGEQLAACARRFRFAPEMRPFSRCLVCNCELETVSRDEVRNEVPFFTYRTQTAFARCPHCRRSYWPGSHRQAMAAKLQPLLDPLLDVSRETPIPGKAGCVPRGTPGHQKFGAADKNGAEALS